MVFRHLKKRHLLFMETIILSWKFLRPITLVRAPMFLVSNGIKVYMLIHVFMLSVQNEEREIVIFPQQMQPVLNHKSDSVRKRKQRKRFKG